MTTNVSSLVGSPITETIGDLTLTIYPLDDFRIGEIDNWIKTRHINMAMAAADKMPGPQGDKVINLALKQAAGMTFLSSHGATLMGSVEGVATVLFFAQSEADRQKNSIDAIKKQLLSPAQIRKANAAFTRLNVDPLMEVTDGAPGEQKPKAKRKRRKKGQK